MVDKIDTIKERPMTIEAELEEIPKEGLDKLKNVPNLRIHIIKGENRWRVFCERKSRASFSLTDKNEALKAAVIYLLTRGGGLVAVHQADGTVKEIWELAKR